MSNPPTLRERLERLRDELSTAHNPWPNSGGLFEGEAKEESYAEGFTACLDLLLPVVEMNLHSMILFFVLAGLPFLHLLLPGAHNYLFVAAARSHW